jgi:two-component sensor histidine kinase
MRSSCGALSALEGYSMSEFGSVDPSARRRAKVKPDANGKPDPSQELLQALQAMRSGDFSVRMTGDHLGIDGKIADTFNEIVAANQRMAQQLERVGQVVGREGKTRQRVKFGLASGSWADMEGSVNTLIDDLLWPTREVTRAVAAVAQGDLLQTVKLDVDGRPLGGEFLQSATIVNTMIKQLSVFTSEVTRVAREVGTEGKLGGQAQVPEVTGVWKDLTESVNSMANNLTGQVRNIAEVTIAVANGDLSKKITVDVRGEILQLKEAINTMVDQLRSFASEVTRVAREVDHRAKNALALAQSIVRLTRGESVKAYMQAVEGRIGALARVHTILSLSSWQGAEMTKLVGEELAPYFVGDQIAFSGSSVQLLPATAQTLAMALHELVTNSAKYGALSTVTGRLAISWNVEADVLKMSWEERNGPAVAEPVSRGFGTRSVVASIESQLGGHAEFDWRSEGLICRLSVPLNPVGTSRQPNYRQAVPAHGNERASASARS